MTAFGKHFVNFQGRRKLRKMPPCRLSQKFQKAQNLVGGINWILNLHSAIKAIKPTAQRRARYPSYFRHFHQTTAF